LVRSLSGWFIGDLDEGSIVLSIVTGLLLSSSSSFIDLDSTDSPSSFIDLQVEEGVEGLCAKLVAIGTVCMKVE